MDWNEAYSGDNRPEFDEIAEFIKSPYWEELNRFIESTYLVQPVVEYSGCSGAPGWNIKYRKSSRALCTLYPNNGYFTCLISIGRKEVPETELMLRSFESYIQELYHNTVLYNGSRWLMIDVTSPEILENVKDLLCIRTHPPKKK